MDTAMTSRRRRPSALLVALVVLLAAWAALSAAHSTPHRLERSAALRAVLADASAGPTLARGKRWTNVRVGAVDVLTPTWGDAQRVRILRLAVGVAAACVALVTISAPSTVDVAQAVMEGGTLLVHGTLPYGKMPGDVFHGDVYPLLGYAVYTPLAIVMPVHDDWDVANGALIVAALSAIAGAWLLARIAGRASASVRELDRPGEALARRPLASVAAPERSCSGCS
jgi:hypothetical protein